MFQYLRELSVTLVIVALMLILSPLAMAGMVEISPAAPGQVPIEPNPALKVTIKNQTEESVKIIINNTAKLPFLLKGTTCKANFEPLEHCEDEIIAQAGACPGMKGELIFEGGGKVGRTEYPLEVK